MAWGGYAPLALRLTSDPNGWSAAQLNRSADAVQGLRRLAPFACCLLTAGTADSLVGFTSWLGLGLQYRPTVTTTGAGVSELTWAPSYEDEFGEKIITNIVSAQISSSGSTGSKATVELVDARTVRVRRFDSGGTPTTGQVFIKVRHRFPQAQDKRVGHYGGALDKTNTPNEQQPYAFLVLCRDAGRPRGRRISAT